MKKKVCLISLFMCAMGFIGFSEITYKETKVAAKIVETEHEKAYYKL